MNLKEQIKALASEQGYTLKDVAESANMSYNGLHDKFRRGSITVRDLETILNVLGYTLTFKRIDR